MTSLLGALRRKRLAVDPDRGAAVAPTEPGNAEALLDLVGIGRVQIDAATKRCARADRRFCELSGYAEAELVGRSFGELAPAADRAASLAAFESVLRGEVPAVAIEHRLGRRDGEIIWVHVTARLLRGRGGQPMRIVAAVRDITQRKRAELHAAIVSDVQADLARATTADGMLRGIAAKLRGALGARRIGFIAFDGGDAAVLQAESEPGLGGVAVWHDEGFPATPVLAELAAGHVATIPERGVAIAPQASDGRCEFVVAIERDPARAWRDDELGFLGELAPRIWLAYDRARAHERLRSSERRLRRAMEIETVGICMLDFGDTIVEANDAFLRMTGHDRAQLKLGLLRWTRTMDSTPAALQALRDGGRLAPVEKQLVRPDGTSWWALCSAMRISDDEAVEFAIDVTERKGTEEQLLRYREQLEDRVIERTAELDAANGALRDEILERTRGELTRQTLLAQLVAAQEDERRRISRELHDVVGQHLVALSLGLKRLGDTAAGGVGWPDVLRDVEQLTQAIGKEIHDLAFELRPTALDDVGLLGTLESYLTRWSVRCGVAVDFHHANWGGERLASPIETTLYRIVCEAFTNILKHARARRVSVILERRGEQAVAIVEDDGQGFDPESAGAKAGNRLGVTGMQERAALVGGEVSVESAPGRGTTVFVRLPLTIRSGGSKS